MYGMLAECMDLRVFQNHLFSLGPRGIASAAHDGVKLGHPCCALT